MKSLLKKFYYQPNVQIVANRFLATFVPPPYKQNEMEFVYGLWEGISAIHCDDGRQLGEGNAGPGRFKESIPTNYRVGNLDGSRSGMMINMTALHNMMKLWDDAIDILMFMRTQYLKHYGIPDGKLTVYQVYIFAKICVAVPAYLARRKNSPVGDGEITTKIAAQFQLISGVFMIMRKMIEKGEPWLSASTCFDAEQLYDYADKNGVLVSREGYACGGATRKIVELLRLSVEGSPKHGVDQVLPEELEGLSDQMENFFHYANDTIEIELAVYLYRFSAIKSFEANGLLAEKVSDNDSLAAKFLHCSVLEKETINHSLRIVTEFVAELNNTELTVPEFSENEHLRHKNKYFMSGLAVMSEEYVGALVQYSMILEVAETYFNRAQSDILKYLGFPDINCQISKAKVSERLDVLCLKTLREGLGVNLLP